MQAGDWATWAGSAAATIAAVASVAVWWRDRSSVAWTLQLVDHGRSRVVNAGNGTAKRVHVRVGSAADPTDVNAEERADTVAPGEVVPVLVAPGYGGPQDFAVVVTWRGRFGRLETWKYRVT